MRFMMNGFIFGAVALASTALSVANANDKIVPIKATASSLGNIRTDTCAALRTPRKNSHKTDRERLR